MPAVLVEVGFINLMLIIRFLIIILMILFSPSPGILDTLILSAKLINRDVIQPFLYKFVDAIVQTVKANEAYVPPYGSGATLYIRPYMFGINPVIGVKPATDYQFRVFATPVGPYFKGGVKPLTLCVSDFDRAAPHGTGHIKAGLNYAMSLHAIVTAHANGFDENMYLDSATRTKVEETGGANFLFVTKKITL